MYYVTNYQQYNIIIIKHKYAAADDANSRKSDLTIRDF